MAAVAHSPGLVFNWNLTEASSPAVVVQAYRYEDVERVVRDTSRFPTPVLAVGAMHSVNACITNNGGTLLNMSALNLIVGLEAHRVRVQAGVTMADLYDWLAKRDLELSFCPEIGDATVGSLAVTTSKDSSIDGPGYLSALVTEVKYVNESGSVVTLTRRLNPCELAAFTCSYGMLGIVLEVVLETRRRIPIISTGNTKTVRTGAEAVAAVIGARAKADALFAILVPDKDYVYLEYRQKAKASAFVARHPTLGSIATAGENDICRAIMVNTKYTCFLKGQPPSRTRARLFGYNFFPFVHFRNIFTNRYPAIEPGSRRLDFSYYEFNMTSLEAVMTGCWDFHKQFKAQHGFAPRGYGIYFVNRGWTPDGDARSADKKAAGAAAAAPVVDIKAAAPSAAAGAAGGTGGGGKSVDGGVVLSKPYGNYSQWGPGVSFMLDPITDDADSPLWVAFNEAYTAWAVSMGAIPSLSQTKGLKPGQVTLPKALTRERFLTPYYKSFVV